MENSNIISYREEVWVILHGKRNLGQKWKGEKKNEENGMEWREERHLGEGGIKLVIYWDCKGSP